MTVITFVLLSYNSNIFSMGNKQNKTDQNGLVQYDRLGHVVVKESQDDDGEPFSTMEFTRQIQSEKAYNAWVKEIARIEDSESRDTILLPEKHTFTKAGLCGSTGIVNLTYQKFPFVLSSEIENRKNIGKYFNEVQMWYLLYNMIRAGNKFHKLKQKIGDVNPNNVLINDDGQIKVLSTCSIPNEINNFYKLVEEKNAKVYLAPQQLSMDIIQKGQYPNNIDPCRAQVFSIGLTILSSGILEDCHTIYKNYSVDEKLLNHLLQIFQSKYSNYLFTTVVKMLEIRPEMRREASDIYNQLCSFEDNILDLQPFADRASTYQPRPMSYQVNPQNPHQYTAQTRPLNMPINYSQPAYNQQRMPGGYQHNVYQANYTSSNYRPQTYNAR